jgi:succinate dehydrogenase / fumarate reductase flavoprotein subunit
LLVFGRRAGLGAAAYAKGIASQPKVAGADVSAVSADMFSHFERDGAENPYTIQRELQDTMHNLAGIIRTENELNEALAKLEEYKERAKHTSVEGNQKYNPGWHLAMDLRSLLTVSEAVARAALMRTESRGAQTRDDFPKTDPEWGRYNIAVAEKPDGAMDIERTPLPQMPAELAKFFEEPH